MNETTLRGFTRHAYTLARKAAILAALVSLFVYPAQMVLAAAGDLVLSFGTNGIALQDPTPPAAGADTYEDYIQKLVLQPDGMILAGGFSIYNQSNTGNFQISRSNPNTGIPDPTFGNSGYASTNLSTAQPTTFPGNTARLGLMDIALQADGMIVAVGDYATYLVPAPPNPPTQQTSTFAIARFTAGGLTDTSFDPSGYKIQQIGGTGSWSSARAVAVQPSDGKIVVAGYTAAGQYSPHKFAMVRYNTNGSLDTTFGAGGIVTTTPGLTDDEIHSLLIDANGKIVVAGHSDNSPIAGAKGTYRFAVARYNANGSLDTTFGSGGYALTLIGGTSNQGRGLALQPDGKLLVAGSAPVPRIPTLPQPPTTLNSQFVVARYNANGSLDGTFGTAGVSQITFDATAHADYAFTVDVDSFGRVVVGGFSYPNVPPPAKLYMGGTEEMALARLCPSGQLDTTGVCGSGFGTGGKVTLFVGNNDNWLNTNWGDNIYSVVVRPSDGNILAGGASRDTAFGKRQFTMMLFDSGGAASYSITGTVKDGNTPLAGVLLNYNNGGPQTATTLADGSYTITLPGNWTGTIIPTCPISVCPSPVVFFPGGRTYAALQSNQANQSFNTSGVFLPAIYR